MLLGYGESTDKFSSVLLSFLNKTDNILKNIVFFLSVYSVLFYSIRALLLGLASNINLKDVSLDLSCCEVRIPSSSIFSQVFFLKVCSLSHRTRLRGPTGRNRGGNSHALTCGTVTSLSTLRCCDNSCVVANVVFVEV